MPADHSNIQPQPQIRKGLAIASLVLGIIGIPTLGLLGVGAITAIALGAIALVRIKKEPATYGGKGMAIAGIITSAVSLFIGVIVAVTLPLLLKTLHSGRESAAIQNLKAIHGAQTLYQAQNGRFGTIKELADKELLDPNFATGAPLSNYNYISTVDASQDKFCVQATRQAPSVASRDFNIDQDGVIRYVESRTPSPVACGEGSPIAGAQ
jgi:type II secretory pathway pseudopilin PulG